ncbi:MAG: ABC transporter permease, partial [candidate division Zixibacteria bacterium]
MIRRVFFIAKKELIQLLRDKRTLGMLIIAPIIQLIVFGYVATTEVRENPIIVCDQSRSSQSRELINRFVSSGHFNIEGYVDSVPQIDRFLDSGEAVVGIIIPPDFARRLAKNSKAEVGVYIDGTNSNLATILMGYTRMIIKGYSS